jgi:hypothetical protein
MAGASRPELWRGREYGSRGARTRATAGYRALKRKAGPGSELPSTGGSTGGLFAEREAVPEERLEPLRAGRGRPPGRGGGGEWPGAQALDAAPASRVGGGADRVHGEWGVAGAACLGAEGAHVACPAVQSDPDYQGKVRYLRRC